MKYAVAGLLATFALVLCLGNTGAGEKKVKYTIKQIMKKAHKDGLLKKVVGGEASEKEKKLLVELYECLCKNEPPKGSAEDWKARTENIVKAAKEAVKDASAGKALVKAASCGACHKLHK